MTLVDRTHDVGKHASEKQALDELRDISTSHRNGFLIHQIDTRCSLTATQPIPSSSSSTAIEITTHDEQLRLLAQHP